VSKRVLNYPFYATLDQTASADRSETL